MNPPRIRRNIDPFDGTDYITWKIRIRAHLKELQLIKVIDEEVPENKTIEWIKNNDQAVNEIMDYLANSHIGYHDTKSAKISKSVMRGPRRTSPVKHQLQTKIFHQAILPEWREILQRTA